MKSEYENGGDIMEYLTGKEIGGKWGVTGRMVNYYCSSGRIAGAVKKGNLWLVPVSAEKPADKRYNINRKSDGVGGTDNGR